MTAAIAATASVLPKGQFAAMIGVSPGRVSQYIAEGKLFGAALVGSGRDQRIDVAIAREQLKNRLDPSQMAGNGIATRLASPTPFPREALPLDEAIRRPVAAAFDGGPIGDAIRQEKLSSLRMDNRRKAVSEAEQAGRLVDAEAVRAEMRKIAREVLAMCEGALPELAAAVAARFHVPQRDVLHLIRTTFSACRASSAQVQTAMAETLPRVAEVAIAGDDMVTDDQPPLADPAE